MISIKQSHLNSEVLKELNYPFGDVFIFDGFVVSEIKDSINFSWSEHAQFIVSDVTCFLGTDGRDLIYISNRINSYAVVAIDWLKFFKYQYSLKGYYIVSHGKLSRLNLMVEELFFKKKIKHFDSIHSAINWVANDGLEIA